MNNSTTFTIRLIFAIVPRTQGPVVNSIYYTGQMKALYSIVFTVIRSILAFPVIWVDISLVRPCIKYMPSVNQFDDFPGGIAKYHRKTLKITESLRRITENKSRNSEDC